MNIAVIGTGYVGLVSGACLADKGHHVICVDSREEVVNALRDGHCPIHEEGLPEILERNVGKTLSFTTDLGGAVTASRLTLIAVGTPTHDGEIDLSQVRTASRQIGQALRNATERHTIILKSTCVPGTTRSVVADIIKAESGKAEGPEVGFGANPEFLTEGQAVPDFMNPDRLVFGADTPEVLEDLRELYAAFPDAPRVETNTATAEMIKYSSNVLLATLVSFSNEIGNVAAAVGNIDGAQVMAGMHLSQYLTRMTPRYGRSTAQISGFLQPGCGYGGSCLPKDLAALVKFAEGRGVDPVLLRSVGEVNRRQPNVVLDLLRNELGDLQGKTIGILGLAFKPDTSDTRQTPAVPVMSKLNAAGCAVLAYDPVVKNDETVSSAAKFDSVDSVDALLERSDAVVLITKWEEFADLPDRIRSMSNPPLVVDGRQFYDPQDFSSKYVAVGSGRID
ncbi:MAG: UDP-glucose/GDP-mannose dehydrogenase family protein [Myxococcales bacterium]|nr:UDP-glucose/GDP-mannose dehydrogenase family protein [Myxococcales bacterium]MDH3485973.1 UDP-glucose/GDP-mannose dehydrogenase family protein [Myxococcales bacterium]